MGFSGLRSELREVVLTALSGGLQADREVDGSVQLNRLIFLLCSDIRFPAVSQRRILLVMPVRGIASETELFAILNST